MSTVEKQNTGTMYGVEPYKETKGEEYMGEPMKKHFTKLLNAWKGELMQSVDRTVDHMKDEAANFPDRPTVPARKKNLLLSCATVIASAS